MLLRNIRFINDDGEEVTYTIGFDVSFEYKEEISEDDLGDGENILEVNFKPKKERTTRGHVEGRGGYTENRKIHQYTGNIGGLQLNSVRTLAHETLHF